MTLDDQERKLEPHMLVITDRQKPIALAGVMGGANSEVTRGYDRILLESAKFDGGTIRKTSRQLGLRSESSLRFEKEVNPELVVAALNRAAELILETAGGQAAAGIASAVTQEFIEPVISNCCGARESISGHGACVRYEADLRPASFHL